MCSPVNSRPMATDVEAKGVLMHTQDRPQARTLATGALTLGDVTFDCAVVQLPDGNLERVLSTRQFTAALGRGHRRSGTLLPPFLAPENLSPFVHNEIEVVRNPIIYTARGGRHTGYPASFLVDVCNVYLHARRDGALREQQEHIAARCEEILGALAKVGIVALVDEATGYQREREDDALQQFLNRYLAHHPLPWRETFAQDYYVQLHRLAGKAYDPATRQRGVWVGYFTKKYVYDYLLPVEGYQQLCAKNPRTSEAHYGRTHNHHQFLRPRWGNLISWLI